MVTFTFNSNLPNGGVVPDGSAVPWSDTRQVSGINGLIQKVALRLSLEDGYNGDLYAYISHGGKKVPLLNRVGVGSSSRWGYGDPGLDVTFSDEASRDIHLYQQVPQYRDEIEEGKLWRPDGRDISPLSDPADFDASGTVFLSVFQGMDPNGEWTLVIGDVVSGGGTTTVEGWELSVETSPIPEPTMWGLGMGGVLLAWMALHRRKTSSS